MAAAGGNDQILAALARELDRQGQGGAPDADPQRLTAYPIKGTIDLVALAEAVKSAVGATASSEDDVKSPADLNAANDG